AARDWADYSRTRIEVLGSERANYGPRAGTLEVREAVLRVAVMHPDKAALELFAREIAPAGTSWSPGTTGADGRPSPSPCIRQFAFMLDKRRLQPSVLLDGKELAVDIPCGQEPVPTPPGRSATVRAEPVEAPSGELVEVP